MSAYDALLGTLSVDGVALELGSGLNFVAPLTAVRNALTKKIDVSSSGGGGGGGGGITGPGTTVVNRIALWNDTAGGALKDAGVTVADVLSSAASAASAGDAAVAASIPGPGGAPGAVNLAGVAASAGTDPDYSRQDHGHSLTGRLPYANQPTIATDSLLGRDTASTGDVENITLDAATLAMNGSGVLQVPSQIGPRGASNVLVDMLPSTDSRGTILTGNSVNFDVAIAAGKIYEITLGLFVDDGVGGACKLSKAIAVTAHQVSGATVQENKDVVKSSLTAGWTLEGAISGTNYRFTLANASGSTGKYRALGGYVRSDKPT